MPLSKYVSDIEDTYTEMSANEEREATKEQLIKNNLKFVVKIANDFKNLTDGTAIEDLVQAGNRGLIRAAEKYDPLKSKKHENKFITYATWWIKKYIRNAIVDHQLIKNKKDHKQRVKTFSINSNISYHEDELNDLENILDIDDQYITPFEELDCKDICKVINNSLDLLTAMEKDVILHRYGLNDINEVTLEILADKYGYTIAGIRNVEIRAKNKLKDYLVDII